jgi:hypothetical protein
MGLALPLTARIIRPDAFGAILPASVVIAVGGMGVVQCIRGDRPLRAVTCLCAMMTLTTISASQWIFPYMERFKSPRSFSMEVKKIVSPTAALYIYADTMNDFNYYMARETIPILSSPESVDALLAGGKTSYMLVKERDFKRLPQLPQQKIVASDAKGSTTWYLVEIGNRAAIASAH